VLNNHGGLLTNRDRPLAEVLADSRQVCQQLVDFVEALPEADLMEPGRFEWMEGHALGPAAAKGLQFPPA
jgi:hypothetical protein